MPESMGAKIFFIYCFPMLALFKYSIIDVRKKKWTNYYPITMVTTVVWLAFMAEGMMTGAETAGCIMEIPEDVMGLTVAAAGTSLPNLFASLIVAKQGLGNMSVSNAFGSNTFNIFIALAVSAGTHKQQPTATHSTAQHSTAQHSTAQHSTAQHSNPHRIPAQDGKALEEKRGNTILARRTNDANNVVWHALQQGRSRISLCCCCAAQVCLP
jgi:hypothetical protein